MWDECCAFQRAARTPLERKWWVLRLLADTVRSVHSMSGCQAVLLRDSADSRHKMEATVSEATEMLAKVIVAAGDIGDPTPLLDMTDEPKFWG